MRQKSRFINWLLKPLLQKKCPSNIPRTGEKGAMQNCFIIYVYSNDTPILLVDEFNNYGVCGRRYDRNIFSNQASIPLEWLKFSDFKIRHYYGLNKINYNGLVDYFINGKTRLQYLKIHVLRFIDKSSQHIFNRKKLVMPQKLDILRVLVENNIENAGNGIGVIDLMVKLYSIRWLDHPEGDSQEYKISLYLDSLAKSGEVEKHYSEYSVTGKALTTIEDYEKEERRHNNVIWLQRMMVLLTFLLALFSLIQAEVIKVPCLLDLR